jgi:hypothetical protein
MLSRFRREQNRETRPSVSEERESSLDGVDRSARIVRETSDRPIDNSWSILRGENDGRPMCVRLNTGARDVASDAIYGIRVGVAISITDC